ncbi:hypothetical protein P692DRAFT_20925869 [Suillus brevipes Sb2]|nr:hypothetical protein P692DRAFT_20925869 [Suillus brevipes Sb2]
MSKVTGGALYFHLAMLQCCNSHAACTLSKNDCIPLNGSTRGDKPPVHDVTMSRLSWFGASCDYVTNINDSAC